MKLKLGVLVVAALWPVAAFSATDFFVSGDQLYDFCQEKNPACTSYIAGRRHVIDYEKIGDYA